MKELSVLSDGWVRTRPREMRVQELLSGQLSDKGFQPYIPKIAENPRQSKRADSVYAEHVVERRSIVRENHRPALTRAPPQASLAIRELPITDIHTHVSVQQLEATRGGDGSRWRTWWQPIGLTHEIEHRG